MGSALTLILAATVFFYSVVKVRTILHKQDVDIAAYYTDHELGLEDKFNAE